MKNLFMFLLFSSLMTPRQVDAAPAKELYDLPPVVAVQNRTYYLDSDLTVQLGSMPASAFNKGYPIGLSYTHFFSDYLAWEVVNANYSINSETNLKNDFEDQDIEVKNTGFEGALDYITYFAMTNIVYTPLYTKSLLFNQDVVHGEVSFVFGGGVANYKQTGARGMVSLGMYLRYFTENNRSWKFDFRDNIVFEESQGAVHEWTIMVGYSFQLGDGPTSHSIGSN